MVDKLVKHWQTIRPRLLKS